MAVEEPGFEWARSQGCNNIIERQNTQNPVLVKGGALESGALGGGSQSTALSLTGEANEITDPLCASVSSVSSSIKQG